MRLIILPGHRRKGQNKKRVATWACHYAAAGFGCAPEDEHGEVIASASRSLRVAGAQLGENAGYVTHAPMLGALPVFHPENIAGGKAKGATSRGDPE